MRPVGLSEGRWLGTGDDRLLPGKAEGRLLQGETEGELPALLATETSSGGASSGVGSFSSLLPADSAIGGVLPPSLLPPQAPLASLRVTTPLTTPWPQLHVADCRRAWEAAGCCGAQAARSRK